MGIIEKHIEFLETIGREVIIVPKNYEDMTEEERKEAFSKVITRMSKDLGVDALDKVVEFSSKHKKK